MKRRPVQKLPSVGAKDWLGKRVLVVDDNETNRLILTSYLDRWKLTSHAVASGKEALSWLRTTYLRRRAARLADA